MLAELILATELNPGGFRWRHGRPDGLEASAVLLLGCRPVPDRRPISVWTSISSSTGGSVAISLLV
jgi:hypothetical protein